MIKYNYNGKESLKNLKDEADRESAMKLAEAVIDIQLRTKPGKAFCKPEIVFDEFHDHGTHYCYYASVYNF